MKKLDTEIFDDTDHVIQPKSKKTVSERTASAKKMGEPSMWAIIGIVFFCVIIVLMIVYNREKEKPDSPQAYVAAKFSQLFNVQEWKQGMGPKPLLYHPAALNAPVWMPLPGKTSQQQPVNQGARTGTPLQTCPAGTTAIQQSPNYNTLAAGG
ncbi:MAG: hypothetical protein HQK67_00530 [Desulfamplus sp.]|nr:hypothetical protein [Desulfamplus sp.]